MSPEVTTPSLPLVVYEQNEQTLVEAAARAKGLTIKGPDDRAGYDLVRSNRLALKGFRVAIDKQRKSLNEDALDWQRRVNAEAKRLTALIEPTERELDAEEHRIDVERERIKAEAEAARKAKLDERVAAFASFGVQAPPSAVAELSDEDFALMLSRAANEYEAKLERERLVAEQVAREKAEREAAEAEARRVEQERLAEQRAELERQKVEQAAERKRLAEEAARVEADRIAAQAKLDADRKALEAERAAIEAAKVKPAPVALVEPETPPLFPEIAEAGPVIVAIRPRTDFDVLLDGLRAVLELIESSRGVVGLHLNGDEAPWEELRAGGRFESWLAAFDEAVSLAGVAAERARKAEGS